MTSLSSKLSFFFSLLLLLAPSLALAWESSLLPLTWVPPDQLSSPPSFQNDKIIQDFSYAGYRRSEAPIPNITGPLFNVLDFGADPDGVADSTDSIQAAIDQAQSQGGGVVYLPSGTFRVRPPEDRSYALSIASSHIVLRGAGKNETFLFNDAWQMRGKSILRIQGPGSNWSSPPAESPETLIRQDLLGPTRVIPVESVDGFAPGDWIVLRADATDPFKEEHQMGDLWVGQSLGAGLFFVRQIRTVDATTQTLSIDVPIRYYLKTRDLARVHLLGSQIEEIGLEDFSIGNLEHPSHGSSSGWSPNDYSTQGTHAWDVHGSFAIRLNRVRNSWIRNVATYRPPENTRNAHLLSNGLRIGYSQAITVENAHFQRALYGGGGGNGYMIRLTHAQEVLMKDTTVGFNRHGFVFSHMKTSGNVILRGRAEHTGWQGIGGYPGSSGSDHHMWLSQSNLIDSTELLQDYFAAYYRHTWGSNHGQTSVHTVYWNLHGMEYFGSRDYIVNSQQARYGYVIGTRGPAPGVSTSGASSHASQAWRTAPLDHVEGVGQGASLQPGSLFEWQLQRRLNESGLSTPSVQIYPPGGTFYAPRQVILTTELDDSPIHYTLDGTNPTEDSPLYTAPLSLSSTAELRAIAHLPAQSSGAVATASFSFPDELCFPVVDQWQSTLIPHTEDTFEVLFEAVPAESPIDSVMGLAQGPATAYQHLAAIARFNPDGFIDARNGAAYDADLQFPYQANQPYQFRILGSLTDGTYDVFVRPEGEAEVQIASHFAFRLEQIQVSSLNRFSTYAGAGQNQICELLFPAYPEVNETDTGDDGDHTPDPEDREHTDPLEEDPSDQGSDQEDHAQDQPLENLEPNHVCGCAATDGPTGDFLLFLLLLGLFRLRNRHRRRQRTQS